MNESHTISIGQTTHQDSVKNLACDTFRWISHACGTFCWTKDSGLRRIQGSWITGGDCWGVATRCEDLAPGTVDSGATPECHLCRPFTYGEGVFAFGFWFLACYATTPLALQFHQERIQVVRSNRVARKRPEGTRAMDLGNMNVVSKFIYICML